MPSQKSKKIVKSSEPVSEPVSVTESVIEPVSEPVTVTELEPVLETAAPVKKQRGGNKKTLKEVSKKVETAPAVEEVVSVPVVKTQKGGAKDYVNENEELDDKTRSFKVKLPNDQEFVGRFTGLTPYQAANKALSKYFRTNDNTNIIDNQVIFTIKESTRGSKRHEYTYKGTRIKLEQPITYTIKSANNEERVITKQYKNQLIKVKKGNNLSEVAPVNA